MFGFDPKDVFGVPSVVCCFLVLKWKNQKRTLGLFGFLNGYDQSRYQKTKELMVSLFFETVQCRKPNLKCWKPPKNDILIDHIRSKKQKTMFFWWFSMSKQKTPKKTRENKKTFWVNSKHALKSVVFLVFWFCLSFFSFPGFVCFSRCGPRQVWL